jgi:DNA-binding beta-propeller fold protein YncE
MLFCVNKNIPAVGPAPVGGSVAGAPAVSLGQQPPSQPVTRDAVLQTESDGTLVYGRNAAGQSVITDPKNVAVGPDGKIFVVEGKTARVTVFNPDGTIAASWGGPGQGNGQFQEPWGIAVAPNGNVYVADTWNHRVQYFDPTGKFLGTWGKLGDAKGSATSDPGIFWGPRAIAISQAGDVYVTDTGNKRVQVFSLDGTFERMFGGSGSAPGQFNEEVGLSLDAQGNVYVADTWNNRIQKLTSNGEPLLQIPVPGGWQSQAVTNKPYLTVDASGRIIASLPDQGQVIVFGPDGQQIKQMPLPGGGSPVGVAAAPNGRLLVADARGNVVDSFANP